MSSSGMNGISGASAIGDTLEFVRGLWGAMKIPGMSMPSMSPEDIDKQIADLKAVEAWLQMNMNMLRGTIQTLEVQSATLSALRSMSESFAQAAAPAGDPPPSGMPSFESPFATASTTSGAAGASASARPEASPAGALPDAAALAAQFGNPAAWWNAVQEQFQHAVSQAVAPPKKPARKTAGTKKKAASPGKATDGGPTRRRRSGA